MKPILLKELKQRRFSLIAYCLAALAFLWLYISLFPYIQQQSQNYMKMLESFPKGLMEAFGFENAFFTNIQGYMASEMYTLIWPLLALFLLISHAGSSIAGEIENGTIGTLLAQPISRLRLFAAKYLSGVITLVIFIAVTVLSCMPIAAIYKLEFNASHFMIFSIAALLFGLAVYSFALMVSALHNEKSQVYFITGGVLFAMYVLNIVAGLKPGLANLKYASVFHYFSPGNALIWGHIDTLSILVFVIATVVFGAIGLIAFKRRDISI
jgi:ABC-2 type transport system permease protein